MDEIGKFVKGGEPARMFGDNVIVYSEMHVRKIVLDVMKTANICPACGQVPNGQGGEYPCPTCGVPTMHDA